MRKLKNIKLANTKNEALKTEYRNKKREKGVQRQPAHSGRVWGKDSARRKRLARPGSLLLVVLISSLSKREEDHLRAKIKVNLNQKQRARRQVLQNQRFLKASVVDHQS